MLAIKEKVFNKFWCSQRFIDRTSNSSQKFKLLGQRLILWLNNSDEAVKASDRRLDEDDSAEIHHTRPAAITVRNSC